MLLICEKCRVLYTGPTDYRCCLACGKRYGSDEFWVVGEACPRCDDDDCTLVEAVVMSRAEARKLAGVVDETPAQGSQS